MMKKCSFPRVKQIEIKRKEKREAAKKASMLIASQQKSPLKVKLPTKKPSIKKVQRSKKVVQKYEKKPIKILIKTTPHRYSISNQTPRQSLTSEKELLPEQHQLDARKSMPISKKSPGNLKKASHSNEIPVKANRILRKNLPGIVKTTKSQVSTHKISNITASKDVVGRSVEYKIIERQVLSFLEYGVGSVLYITGVPGSGKTFTTISLLKHLNIDFTYVNCSVFKKKLSIFEEIGACTSCIDTNKTILANLKDHYEHCNNRHVLVIDEIDFLFTKNEKILYNIFEIPFIENVSLMIIVISNTLGLLSSKTESRIGKNRLEFRPYDSEQLKSVILSNNSGNNINEKSLDLIVKKVASSTGDIRKAKDLVESSGHYEIAKVGAFLRDFYCPLLTKFVHSFNLYQKIIMHVNREQRISLNQWFDLFRTFCLAKNIVALEFCDFLFVLNDMVTFGIYTIKNDGTMAVSNYLNEELEQATKNDPDFIQFKSSKI